MPRKGITGHDPWVITEALATAFVALEQLPPKHQPRIQMHEIKKLLAAACQPGCPFHHPRAASSHGVGAEVLAAGGDRVDAVVVTTFALGVLRS
jgi:gamma-glutamyltranspeptidase